MLELETKYQLTNFEINFLTKVLRCNASEIEKTLDSKSNSEYDSIMLLLKLWLFDYYLK